MGTYKLKEDEIIQSVLDAGLECGYRMIGKLSSNTVWLRTMHDMFRHLLLSDTAAVYRNEQHIGTALKLLCPKYGLRLEDVFITSKLGEMVDKYVF